MGMQIDQNVDVNIVGSGVARITLLNKDGGLTPGGGGTYSAYQWFRLGVFVTALTNTGGSNTETPVFHGIVREFELQDDGVFSTVTITAYDAMSVGGRTPAVSNLASSLVAYFQALGESLNPSGTDYYPVIATGTSDSAVISDFGGDRNRQVYTVTTSANSIADLVQTRVVPAANDVLWATKIQEGGAGTQYLFGSLPFTTTRNVANTVDMEFDPPGSLSGSKLPFDIDSFQQGFTNETLITNVTIQGNYAGATAITVTNAGSAIYGSRSQSFTNTYAADATEATSTANRLVNRYGDVRFTPISMQLTATLVNRLAANAAHSKWHSLLGIETGIWQRAKITWTGSGASSQTAYCVIKGRRISVTPADTVVTLNLGNWADNHGFILDTDQLDVDRLG
jgi:hypothetical protein